MSTKQRLRLYNSLSGSKEDFVPVDEDNVGLYTCGFTVYDHVHIGHVKKYVGDDVLRRTLVMLGYSVRHVQNVTDVGHLESDADEGEDKLEKGAAKHNLSVFEVARRFEKEFYNAMDEVNVLTPSVIKRAADDDAIDQQIKLIGVLLEKGYGYVKDAAIYFDVGKLPDYNPFSKQPLSKKLVGAREGVEVDPDKKNPADFVLWMFKKGRYANHAMSWGSPWGEGFPGWHIECSAISMHYLGDHIDIHTGGVDHLPVHHPNEIAQNFGVTSHRVVNYWVHHEHLKVDGEKMSKSKGNFFTLEDVKAKGFDPIALRYLVLNTHYRKQMNFTWESLAAAQSAVDRLRSKVVEYMSDSTAENNDSGGPNNTYISEFTTAMTDDLNTPKALAQTWMMLDSELSSSEKLKTLLLMDTVLGLALNEDNTKEGTVIPDDVLEFAKQRWELKRDGKFIEADGLRDEIAKRGYTVRDLADSYELDPS
ncbi:cysteine--tRNA ligase [candidate division WWE3 bacterium]|uniref:Cysteine--tRNA ligase n=1 Tax=candidate division WWE3 bacterium TaxID=2053526 RepID=A0A955LJS2_UNCKA|nr:cysteine--tRNA ligase [candidate division WWE3 bacterium]